ncbi:MAG TPA: hypothetical protein VGS10_14570 [Terracidiphilus sp.]|nr:hypothetical protein [Terracidiphilus sp.]
MILQLRNIMGRGYAGICSAVNENFENFEYENLNENLNEILEREVLEEEELSDAPLRTGGAPPWRHTAPVPARLHQKVDARSHTRQLVFWCRIRSEVLARSLIPQLRQSAWE